MSELIAALCIAEDGGVFVQVNNDRDESDAMNMAFKFWLNLKPSSWPRKWILKGVPLDWKDIGQPEPAMHC